MWKLVDLIPGARYRVGLVQEPGGKRSFVLLDENDLVGVDGCVLQTEIVPPHLLMKRDVLLIAENVCLTNGEHFFVDAHGVWLTQAEMDVLDGDDDGIEVPWLNGVAPIFAPR